MSYRTSTYDPLASKLPGRPLRPFNAVQWLGVILALVGGVLGLTYLAAGVGWTSALIDSPAIAFWLAITGSFLVSSRRESDRIMTQAERRRGTLWLLGSLLVSFTIVAAIVIIGGV